ncbi:MAG: GNAT family N-acetyltransferase [Rudaea sp.]
MSPEGRKDFLVRAPTAADLTPVFDLIIACDIADSDQPDTDLVDVQTEWGRQDFDLAADAWVVQGADGRIVAYADVCPSAGLARVSPLSGVHPDYRRLGLGTALLRRAEARAREQAADGAVIMQTVVNDANAGAKQLMGQEGYRPVRYDWQMHIEMAAPPPAPQFPAGLTVRTFEPGRDERAVHAVIQESFRDTWSHPDMPFDVWAQFIFRENFEPAVSYLVFEGHEMVAATMCFNYASEGWVRQLGVRRPWRQRGIGLALLHQIFGEFYRRGVPRVGLVVDSESLTGATRLYERAGMHASHQFNRYQKVAR